MIKLSFWYRLFDTSRRCPQPLYYASNGLWGQPIYCNSRVPWLQWVFAGECSIHGGAK